MDKNFIGIGNKLHYIKIKHLFARLNFKANLKKKTLCYFYIRYIINFKFSCEKSLTYV